MYDNDNNITSFSIQPTQAIASNEYSEQWYKRNLRWISTMYNRTLPQTTGTGEINYINYAYKTFVEQVQDNYNYYQGNQTRSPFSFFLKDETNRLTTTPAYRGMDIKILVDKLVGNLVTPLKKLHEMVTAASLSPNAVSRKMAALDLVMLRYKNDIYFSIIEEVTGVGFEPIGEFDYSDKEAIDKYFTNFRESLEIAVTAIAKSTVYNNHHESFLFKSALYYATAGVVHAISEVNASKRVRWRLIAPENAIFDLGVDNDDNHRNDRFAGEIYMYSIPELASLNILTKEELAEAEYIARTTTQWSTYNYTSTNSNFYWWMTNSLGVPTVACIKGVWRSLKNIGTEEKPEWIECVREGMLIGNKWVKNFGERQYNVEDFYDKSRLKLGYITVTAPTLNGVFQSVVDTLKRYQDLKDALKGKLIQFISRSKGKVYMVFSDRLPEGMNTPQILSQLTQAGMVVLPSTDFDEYDKNNTLIQTIDMTLDPGIMSLVSIIANEQNYMEQIVSYNPVSLGNVTNYVSKDQIQASTAGTNAGLAYFTSSFYSWVTDLVNYSSELTLKAMANDDLNDEYMSVVIGDAMVEVVKSGDLKDASMETFNIGLTIDDFISEQERMQLMQVALQMASAGAISMSDYTKMLQCTTKSQLQTYFDYVEYKKEKAAQQAQEAQMMAAQQNAQIQADASKETASIAADAKLADTELKGMMAAQQPQM
jgi:hypothetical protein